MNEETRWGFVITDDDGREIAYCDGDYEAAEILREAVFGCGIVPVEDYEDPDEEEEF